MIYVTDALDADDGQLTAHAFSVAGSNSLDYDPEILGSPTPALINLQIRTASSGLGWAAIFEGSYVPTTGMPISNVKSGANSVCFMAKQSITANTNYTFAMTTCTAMRRDVDYFAYVRRSRLSISPHSVMIPF